MTEYCRASRDYRHEWSEWGLFRPEPLPPYQVIAKPGAVPANVTVKAARERLCHNCRGVQREQFGSGDRAIFYPGNDGY